MNPQSKYILFYSKKCVHSREFLETLYQNQPLFNKFIKVDVQNTTTNIPKCITAVPAIIIKTPNMKPQIFVGDEVFQWYNQFLSRINSSTGETKSGKTKQSAGSDDSILDYDPCTMSGFSDNFSLLDSGNQDSTIEHQFAFLGRGDLTSEMLVAGANNLSLDNQKKKSSEGGEDKSQLEMAYEQLQAQRSLDVPKAPERKGGGVA